MHLKSVWWNLVSLIYITFHGYFIYFRSWWYHRYISVSCHRNICDITDTTSVWTEELGFKRVLCEGEYISDQYISGTIYGVLPLTYKLLLETLCMSNS